MKPIETLDDSEDIEYGMSVSAGTLFRVFRRPVPIRERLVIAMISLLPMTGFLAFLYVSISVITPWMVVAGLALAVIQYFVLWNLNDRRRLELDIELSDRSRIQDQPKSLVS